MKSKICEICDIKYPIILGPMVNISKAPLVAAFSKSGGLGCLASSGMSEDVFHKEIALIRKETNLPFAVNIAWPTPNAEEIIEWCVKDDIRIIVSSAGFLYKGLQKAKSIGCKIFQVVANLQQALKAEKIGVDGIIAKGFESGGLNAPNAVATLPLIPQMVDAVDLPVIAAGGIGDGRGFAAAMALGAEGVLMGTKLLTTTECPIHENYKNAIIRATDDDLVSLDLEKFSARFLKNKRVSELKKTLTGSEPPWEIVKEAGVGVNTEKELLGAGQIAGLIKQCCSVEDVIKDLMNVFEISVKRLNEIISEKDFH
jgi:enoyl-[acyl-carrier protein] reductase II